MSEVQSFTACMQSEDTRTIFDRANESRKEKSQSVRPWLVTEHPDWSNPKRASTQSNGEGTASEAATEHSQHVKVEEDDADDNEGAAVYDEEGLKKLLTEWRNQYPGCHAKIVDHITSKIDVCASRISKCATYRGI